MFLRRLALLLLVAGAWALFAALPAGAKEDVEATLMSGVPLDAPAGTRLTVSWSLFSVDENGGREPFGANGVFVRLLSASGAQSEEAVASPGAYETGEYEATVTVPEGGIRDIELGLQGWVSDAAGTRRSDLTFPITNDPVPNAAASSVAAGESGAGGSGGGSSLVLSLSVGVTSLLAVLAGSILIYKRRSRDPARTGRNAPPPVSPRASSKA